MHSKLGLTQTLFITYLHALLKFVTGIDGLNLTECAHKIHKVKLLLIFLITVLFKLWPPGGASDCK